MSFLTSQGSFTVPASTATGTTVTLSFDPKAIILLANGATADGNSAEARMMFVAGGANAGTSTFTGAGSTFAAANAVSTTTVEQNGVTSGIALLNSAGSNVFSGAVTLGTGQFSITWGTVTSGVIVQYLAIGGTDITNTYANGFNPPTVTGNQAITGVGFLPDVLIMSGRSVTGPTGPLSDINIGIGVGTGPANRWCVCFSGHGGQTMTNGVDAMRGQRTDSVYMVLNNTGAVDSRADLASLDEDGFTLNWVDAASSSYTAGIGFLAIKGGTWLAGASNKPTGAATANQDVTTGFSPVGLFLSSWNAAASTTITADNKGALGISDGTNEASIAWDYKDVTIPTSANKTMTSTKALRLFTGASTTDAECDSSFTAISSGFRLAWTTNNATAVEICYLAMGANIPNTVYNNKLSWSDHLNCNHGPFSITHPVLRNTQKVRNSDISGIGRASSATSLGQSVIIGASDYSTNSIFIALKKTASPTDNVQLNIQSDSSNHPSGTVVGTANAIAASSIGTATGWYEFTFSSPVTLSASTKYWLVLSRSGAIDATNYISAEGMSGSTSTEVASQYDGATWSNFIDGTEIAYIIRDASTTNADLYTVLLDKTANKVRCCKSTDAGATWSILDYNASPASSSTTNYKSADSKLSNTIIYSYKSVSSSSITIEQFDTVTETWGTQIAGPTITLNISGLQTAAMLTGWSRSDGSHVIAYHGATETVSSVNYDRVKVHYRTSGGTWNGPYDLHGSANSPPANTLPGIAQHFILIGSLLGTSDRVHLFYINRTSGDVRELRSRAFLSGNTFGTGAQLDSSIKPANWDAGIPALNSSELLLPYPETTNALQLARATDADSPTWSQQVVSATSTSNPEVFNANPGAVIVKTSTIYVFWPDDTSQNLYQDNDGGNGTWGTDTLWKTLTCNGINGANVGAAAGILYNEQVASGFVFPKYDSYTFPVDYSWLAARPFGPPGASQMQQLLAQ